MSNEMKHVQPKDSLDISKKKKSLLHLRNLSYIVGAFTNIKTHIHKQSDPEQLAVGNTNICSVR